MLAVVALTEKLTEAFRNGYATMAPGTAIFVHSVELSASKTDLVARY